MPHICPLAYVFIAMNMPISCSRFLLTSWCYVVSLIVIILCLLWRCSNYIFPSMIWVLCSNATVVNFGWHMTLLHACKHASTNKMRQMVKMTIGSGALQLSSTNKRTRPEILGPRRKGKGMRWKKNSREEAKNREHSRRREERRQWWESKAHVIR